MARDEYQKKAEEFLEKTGVRLSVVYLDHAPYFDGDKESRAIFRFTLRRGRRSYSGRFGQSIAAGMEEPGAYDILACITKSEPGDFRDFCGEYGYDEDSRKAEKTYKAVLKEWAGVSKIWDSSEIEQLQEIN